MRRARAHSNTHTDQRGEPAQRDAADAEITTGGHGNVSI